MRLAPSPIWPALGCACLLAVLAAPADAQTPAPLLNEGQETETATAGFFTLSWTMPEGTLAIIEAEFELQSAAGPSFASAETIYVGSHLATTVSGQPDGVTYYRVRARPIGAVAWGAWSTAYEVRVQHHPLHRAFLFLGIGSVVFLATFALILAGYRADRAASFAA